MENRKKDALKCIQAARNFLQNGNKNKAESLLLKAEKIYPTELAKELLKTVLEETDADSEDSDAEFTGQSAAWNEGYTSYNNSNRSPPRSPRTTDSSKGGSDAGVGQNGQGGLMGDQNHHSNYTPDQVESVRRVLNCKDYYEILGVAKDAVEDDLKRAYRKLALKFHPDKNQAPGATDAFKAIGNAFAVLTDSSKRERYDRYGTAEEPVVPRHRGGHNGHFYYEYSRGFESDISPEELFNMFFGGKFPNEGTRVYRANHNQPNQAQQRQQNRYFLFLQLLPLFLLFAMSFLSGLFMRDPYFSIEKTGIYVYTRYTKAHNVPYYVKVSFNQDFQGSLPQLEREIEENFVTTMRYNCYQERQQKEHLVFKARFYNDPDAHHYASKLTTPSCDKLSSIYG